jgi:hypothetical protein
MSDITDRARDFKLVETGFSYWATTLNRVAARLALGRVKEDMAALQCERDEVENRRDLGICAAERRELTARAKEAEGEIRRLDLVVQGYMGKAERAEDEEKAWVDKLYDVRSEPDKLLIMVTNKHYEIHRAALQSQGGHDSLHAGES